MNLAEIQAAKAIKNYPRLKTAYLALRSKNSTGGSAEDIALRSLPENEQKAYDSVSKAIRRTLHREYGKERMVVIHLHYWQGRSILETANEVNISENRATWHIEGFRAEVQTFLSVSYCTDCIYFRNLTYGLPACHYFFDTGQMKVFEETESTANDPKHCNHYTTANEVLQLDGKDEM